MIKQLIDKIFRKEKLYSYKDEELTVDNVTAAELWSLSLPDCAYVKEKDKPLWQRWGDIKNEIKCQIPNTTDQ